MWCGHGPEVLFSETSIRAPHLDSRRCCANCTWGRTDHRLLWSVDLSQRLDLYLPGLREALRLFPQAGVVDLCADQPRVAVAEGALHGGQGGAGKLLGFRVAELGAQHVGQFVARHQRFRVVFAQGLLQDCGSVSVDVLGAGFAATLVIESRQVHQAASQVGMLRAERVLPNPDRLAIVGLSLQILALEAARLSEIVECHRGPRMPRRQVSQRRFDGPTGVLFGARIVVHAQCRRGQVAVRRRRLPPWRAAVPRHRHSGAGPDRSTPESGDWTNGPRGWPPENPGMQLRRAWPAIRLAPVCPRTSKAPLDCSPRAPSPGWPARLIPRSWAMRPDCPFRSRRSGPARAALRRCFPRSMRG